MEKEPQGIETSTPLRVLSLDGGGAKGFYSLGVLMEIEALTGKPLCQTFDLIFGTSTGAIIAGLLALGEPVEQVRTLYKNNVVAIMGPLLPGAKSKALAKATQAVFGERKFTDVQTGVGIVATRWTLERPMIFKGNVAQVHGRAATFTPGFGVTIAEAVEASCSAYPFFRRKTIVTNNDEKVELIDGGFCANNPTLYAIADACRALKKKPEDLRVVSVGVGVYPAPKKNFLFRGVQKWPSVVLLQKTLEVNTQSMDQLRSVLFGDVPTVRISDTYSEPEMATDLFERDQDKLDLLWQRGRESFAKHEGTLRQFLL